MAEATNLGMVEALRQIQDAWARGKQELDFTNLTLTELPETLPHLTHLRSLRLRDNQLRDIPDWFSQMTNLEFLDLTGNLLTSIPEAILKLGKLQSLYISQNKLTAIPESIANLSSLRFLALWSNQITKIPDSISQLAELRELYLFRNRITEVSESLCQLVKLEILDLESNLITNIPDSLADLPNLETLSLGANPLVPELAAAKEEGLGALKRYLRGKREAQEILYEAKLIVVGEGEVGKSCLLAALHGDGWVEKRDTTHGIEIKPLKLTDPATGAEITLNGWDFGGQPVYRPTHQLFFSSPAVYLVVWKPREGPQQGFVREWIRLIKHREPAARILVVATHGGPGGRQPDIDRQEIWDLFGKDTVVDFFHVDSRPSDFDEKLQQWKGECQGIRELRDEIAKLAASLPEVGRPVAKRWLDVRDSLKKTGEAYLSVNRVFDICRDCQMSDELAEDFIRISHRLGHLIHYGQDPRLRDIVVLKPDWLATAVSFVLDDKNTRDNHGLVKFSRLSRLWSDESRPDELRYPPKVHPMFVALMERFDLSYRVAGAPLGGQSDETSLIAQLVPDVRPEVDIAREWTGQPEAGDERQMQTCRIVDAKGNTAIAEGLFYQLIVRLHRFSLGRQDFNASVHWQRGLILDDDYNGRALLEHVGNDVRITVRAAYPGNLLAILTSEVKWLVENFWEGLRCEVVVPCLEPCGKKLPGTGVFEVQKLVAFKRQGLVKFPCTVSGCDQLQEIRSLLQNAPAPPASTIESLLTHGFDEMRSRLQELRDQNVALDQSLRRIMSQVEDAFRGLMRTMVDEAKDGPRLFSLEPVGRSKFNPHGWAKKKFNVTLWCEHTRLPLPLLNKSCARGVYEFEVSRQWFAAAAPFLKVLAGTLSLLLPVAASATKLALDEAAYKSLENQLDFGKECANAMLEATGKATDWLSEGENIATARGGMTHAHGGVLREFQVWLKEKDPSFGDLRRVLNKQQEFLWVHPDFEKEY